MIKNEEEMQTDGWENRRDELIKLRKLSAMAKFLDENTSVTNAQELVELATNVQSAGKSTSAPEVITPAQEGYFQSWFNYLRGKKAN
jgi:hypothetical protein